MRNIRSRFARRVDDGAPTARGFPLLEYPMMMAYDSSAGRPQLSAESVSELTTALERYARNETDIAAIQPALRRIADEARAKRVQAEALLVLLKDVWFGLPIVKASGDSEAQHRQLQRLVTLSIREYYA